MSPNKALVLAVVAHAATAQADVYEDVQKLAAKKADGETATAAVQRWQKARQKLAAVAPGTPKDYRHCYLTALVTFRLDGPDAARAERYACTSSLVKGSRTDGVEGSVDTRIASINNLSDLTETFYREEIDRLNTLVLAGRTTGRSKVTVATSRVEQLMKSGKLSREDAQLLLTDLAATSTAIDTLGDKIDPKLVELRDLDWAKLKREDLNSIPTEFQKRLEPMYGTPP